jgi:nucleotide-binding universal stress UspA family protein
VVDPGSTANGRIVVGVDGSPGGRRALEWAVDEARRRDAVLEVVHAWTYPPTEFTVAPEEFAVAAAEVITEAVEEAADIDPSVAVKSEVRQQPAAPALVELSKGADLLVVGSRGRGGFAGLLLGSVSQQCVNHGHCPVVVVRTEGT